MRSVQRHLTPELVDEAFVGVHSCAGHCYVGSEALYHAMVARGIVGSFKPHRARDAEGVTHWWLEDEQGRRLDPTASQYTSRGLRPPYSAGRGGGFLTAQPSRRAQVVLDRLAEAP